MASLSATWGVSMRSAGGWALHRSKVAVWDHAPQSIAESRDGPAFPNEAIRCQVLIAVRPRRRCRQAS